MSLEAYKKKRSFNQTPEPTGGKSSANKLLFVIQKHAASHLHYDFRLEMRGVLKSWAVPKGPSMNPADKRLAMLVEDHPFDYKDFEGIIPKGNYGAGTVIVWDEGTYEPLEQASTKTAQEKLLLKGFHSGSLKIRMYGHKLKGEFALVRTEGRGDNSWLLIKHRDEYASEADITMKDKSVVSGKRLEQVASSKNVRKWISNRTSSNDPKAKAKGRTGKQPNNEVVKETIIKDGKNYEAIVQDILGALEKPKRTKMPVNIKPMLATLVDEPFDNPEWTYEVKWDGYRTIAYINEGTIELSSRNNHSFNDKFYPVYEALKQWPVKAVVDGEIVAVNENGISNFSSLQHWQSEADGELLFYLFDILWLDGIELTHLPLINRRDILRKLIPEEGIIKLSENFQVSGIDFFIAAQKIGLEGIVAKNARSIYISDTRTKLWLKIKTEKRHEAIIAGYTRNEDSRKKFSALILGVYEKKTFKFIGQVGTGFTDKVQTEILKRLKQLVTTKCPFKTEPVINKPTRFRPNPPKADVTWLKPELVCEVRYQELTSDGIMRHASFQGLREDKEPP